MVHGFYGCVELFWFLFCPVNGGHVVAAQLAGESYTGSCHHSVDFTDLHMCGRTKSVDILDCSIYNGSGRMYSFFYGSDAHAITFGKSGTDPGGDKARLDDCFKTVCVCFAVCGSRLDLFDFLEVIG